MFGMGSMLGKLTGPGQQPAAPAAGAPPAAPDGSQSNNPLTRIKTKVQTGKGKHVSDVDLGEMGAPVATGPANPS